MSAFFFSVDSTSDDTIGEARMYARPGDDMCPVKSFKRYLSNLHQDLDDLWQRPRDSFNTADKCWYCKCPLGKNSLGNLMSQISNIAALSQRYTNHCIRATSISALDVAGFEARQIIRATGHKSEASIKSYSSRLTECKKREMSAALSSALLGAEHKVPVVSKIGPDDDIDRVFLPENDFSSAVILPIPAKAADTTTNDVQEPLSPRIINIPYSGGDNGYYNITPHMNNCNVQFHFHGK